MQFVRHEGEVYVFRLGQRERAVFLRALKLYPLVPLTHHQLTRDRSHDANRLDRELLAEAMAAHRRETRRRVELLLANGRLLLAEASGYRLALSRQDLEWLLQVLNDVRVGCWLKLGCPDPEAGKLPRLTAESRPDFLVMEACGAFEGALLEALHPDDPL